MSFNGARHSYWYYLTYLLFYCFLVYLTLTDFLPMSDPMFYMYECEFMSLFADEFKQFSVELLALLSDILLGYLYINL